MNRRTSLITAAAVGATLLAGTGAIAANIGVLSSADDDSIGDLSAETVIQPPPATVEPQVVDIYIEDPPTIEPLTEPVTTSTTVLDADADADGDAQEFVVETAGTVTVEQLGSRLFVSDVQVDDGWSWSAEQSSSSDVTVTFVSGETTYVFIATIGADGQIDARVDQPVVEVVHVAAPAPAQAPAPAPAPAVNAVQEHEDDDGYEDDDVHEREDEEDEKDEEDDEDEEDEPDEDDDEEHEGGDDDD